MKIKRNIKLEIANSTVETEVEIELTRNEISDAHDEHVTNFMFNVLMNDFGYEEDVADILADESYREYCKGNGLTEYECIEEIADQYENGELKYLFD